MTNTSSTSTGRKFDLVIFSPADANYTEWLKSTYMAIKWYSLGRWAIPLKAGELGVQKAKPTEDEEKIEAWEDAADKALVLIFESLGEHSYVVNDCKTPDAAFTVMHDLYSGATNDDAARLERPGGSMKNRKATTSRSISPR